VIGLRLVAFISLGIAFVAGTLADRPRVSPPVTLGGYRVLAADFHMHSSMWSDGALTPWGLVFEASRQGLDAIAITGHNELFDGKLGRWAGRFSGGTTVLVGQEILHPDHHVIAVGIEQVVDSRRPVSDQIDDVHRQGGVAIAAHPTRGFWGGFDERALAKLDGAEVCHPMIYLRPEYQVEYEEFQKRAALAAIGSSDFHGTGRMGMCRTYVFARDNTPEAIVEALREHRTVVYGLGGRAYGDPGLVQLAATEPQLQQSAEPDVPATWLDWVSRVTGVLGLVGVVLLGGGLTPLPDTSRVSSASNTS